MVDTNTDNWNWNEIKQYRKKLENKLDGYKNLNHQITDPFQLQKYATSYLWKASLRVYDGGHMYGYKATNSANPDTLFSEKIWDSGIWQDERITYIKKERFFDASRNHSTMNVDISGNLNGISNISLEYDDGLNKFILRGTHFERDLLKYGVLNITNPSNTSDPSGYIVYIKEIIDNSSAEVCVYKNTPNNYFSEKCINDLPASYNKNLEWQGKNFFEDINYHLTKGSYTIEERIAAGVGYITPRGIYPGTQLTDTKKWDFELLHGTREYYHYFVDPSEFSGGSKTYLKINYYKDGYGIPQHPPIDITKWDCSGLTAFSIGGNSIWQQLNYPIWNRFLNNERGEDADNILIYSDWTGGVLGNNSGYRWDLFRDYYNYSIKILLHFYNNLLQVPKYGVSVERKDNVFDDSGNELFTINDLPNLNIFNWDFSSITDYRDFLEGTETRYLEDATTTTYLSLGDLKLDTASALAIKNLDMSNTTNLQSFFKNNKSFNEDISNWDVGKVTDFQNMFYGATSFNQNLKSWNVWPVSGRYVSIGSNMFGQSGMPNNVITGIKQDRNIVRQYFGQFTPNTRSELDARLISHPEEDISDWNVSKIKNFSRLFQNDASGLEGVSKWNISNATDLTAMFKGAVNFNSNLSTRDVSDIWGHEHTAWDVTNVKYGALMFQNARSFNSDLSGWVVDNMVNMYSMFENATSFDTKSTDYWNINQSAITDKMLKNTNFKSSVGCVPDSGVKFDKYVDKVVSPDISGTHFIFPVGENITQLIPEVKVCYSDVSFNINTNTISNIPQARLVDLSTNNVISSLDISLNFINKPIITGIKKSTTLSGLSHSASLQVGNNIEIQNNLGVHIGFDVSSSIVPYKYKLKSNGVEISNIDISGITFNESSGILEGTPTIADDVQDKDVSFSVIAIVDGRDAPDIFSEETSVFNIKVQKKPEISNYTYNSQTYNNGDLIRLQKDSNHTLTINMATDVVISHYTITPDISSTGLTFDTSTGNISGFADKRVINESYTINAISQGNVESDSFTLRISIKDIGSEEEAINSFATIQSTLPIIEQLQTDINTIKSDIDTKVIDISGKYQNIIDISDVTLNTTAYGTASDISNVISSITAYSNEIAEIDVSLNNAYTTIQDEWEDIKDISNIPSVSILTFVAGDSDASYNKLKKSADQVHTTIKTLISDISNQKQLIDNLLTQGLTHANDLESDLNLWKASISNILNNVNIIDTSRNNLQIDYDSKNLNATITDISSSKSTIDTTISKSDILIRISDASGHINTFKTKYEDISGIKQNLNTISSELSVYKNEKEETLTESSNSSITAVKLYRNPLLSEYVTLSSTITSVSGDITTVLDNVQSVLTSNLDRYDKHNKNIGYLSDLKTWVNDSYTTVLSNVEIIDSSHADLSQNYHNIDINVTIEDISNSKSTIDSSTSKSDILTKISGASEHVSTFKTKYEEITAIKQTLDIIYNNLSSENSTINTSINSIDNSGTNFTKSTELQIYQELLSKITGISGEISFTINNNVEPVLTNNLDRYDKHNKNIDYLGNLKTWVNDSYTTVLSNVQIIDSSHGIYDISNTIYIDNLTNAKTEVDKEKADIFTKTNKDEILIDISTSLQQVIGFETAYDDISGIKNNLDLIFDDLSQNKLNLLDSASNINDLTSIYGPTENITILTTLIGNISNISTKIIETRNRTITELSNNIDNFTRATCDKEYLTYVKNWLNNDYITILQNVNNIDSSYNDLSSNFISNLNNLNNSLQNLDSLIIDISNSDNSSVIIGKIQNASNTVNVFKQNYNSILLINTVLEQKISDLSTNEKSLIDTNYYDELSSYEATQELEIYKQLNNNILNVSNKIILVNQNVETKLEENKNNFETNVDETFNYINTVTTAPDLSYNTLLGSKVNKDISRNVITIPINLQKPLIKFEIADILLPNSLTLDETTGFISGQILESTNTTIKIKGTNLMGAFSEFELEINAEKDLQPVAIENILTNIVSTSDEGEETAVFDTETKNTIISEVSQLNTSIDQSQDISSVTTAVESAFTNIITAVEDKPELTVEHKTNILSNISRNILNATIKNKIDEIPITPEIINNFIPTTSIDEGVQVSMVRPNKAVDGDTTSTKYSPLQNGEFLRVNYRETDLNLQLLTIKVDKDQQSFTSDDIRDYVLQLREIDDTLDHLDDSAVSIIQNFEIPQNAQNTSQTFEVESGDNLIVIDIYFGSILCEISVKTNIKKVDCRTIRKQRLSSSLALSNKKAMTVSKIVGEGANVKCLTKIGGPGDLWSSKQKSKYGVDKKHGSYDRYLARKVGNVLRKQTLARKDSETQRTTYMLTDRTKFVTSRIPNCSGCGNDNTKCNKCHGCLNIK